MGSTRLRLAGSSWWKGGRRCQATGSCVPGMASIRCSWKRRLHRLIDGRTCEVQIERQRQSVEGEVRRRSFKTQDDTKMMCCSFAKKLTMNPVSRWRSETSSLISTNRRNNLQRPVPCGVLPGPLLPCSGANMNPEEPSNPILEVVVMITWLSASSQFMVALLDVD